MDEIKCSWSREGVRSASEHPQNNLTRYLGSTNGRTNSIGFFTWKVGRIPINGEKSRQGISFSEGSYFTI